MADRVPPRVSSVDPDNSQTEILPIALSDASAIVASAPLATEPYGAAIVSALQYDVDQVLFGFEAQLRAFAHALRRHHRQLALAPLPELFASPRSLAAIAADGRGTAPIVHLRFGPMHHARVLKGVRNIMVCADAPRHLPADGAVHPFGGGRRLPAPFATVFRYAGRQDAAADLVLADAFLDADIASEALAPADGVAPIPSYAAIAGLHIRSFAEVLRDPERTPPRPADALDWRAALAGEGGTRARLMLPWNLANPASLVPDLVRKLSRRASDRESGWRLVVFPFNATPVSGGMIAELAAATREQVGRQTDVLRGLFVARLRDLRDAHRLRTLFPLAWLEEDDAESVWTGRRLARLGIRVGLLGAPSPDIAHDLAVATDEPLRLTVSDSFGDRTYVRRSLSARQIAALLVRSGVGAGP
jgi:hypothetical protein